jgi:hypothetical protein
MDDNKELVEKIADSMMEYLPSNMGVFNPDDPTNYKWAKAIANNCAQAALSIIQPELQKGDEVLRQIEKCKETLEIIDGSLDVISDFAVKVSLRSIVRFRLDHITALKTTTGHDNNTEKRGKR